MTIHIPKSVLTWFGIVAVVIVAFIAGKGSDDDDQSQLPSNLPKPEINLQVANSRPVLAKDEAGNLLRDYYSSIDDNRFATAWKPLAPEVRDEMQGYDAWRAGHEYNETIEVEDLWIERISRLEAVAHVTLRSIDKDACNERIAQRFSGTWHVSENSNQLVLSDPDIEKVAGAEIAEDSSSCVGSEPDPVPYAAPSSEYEPTQTYAAPSSSDDFESDTYDTGSDLDCGDISETNIDVTGGDPNGFDSDGDGIGCEG